MREESIFAQAEPASWQREVNLAFRSLSFAYGVYVSVERTNSVFIINRGIFRDGVVVPV